MASLTMRIFLLILLVASTRGQRGPVRHNVGRLTEVFAWKQITFNINGVQVLEDRSGEVDLDNTRDREKRQSGKLFFDSNDNGGDGERNWNQNSLNGGSTRRPSSSSWTNRPTTSTTTSTSTTASPNDEAGRFFVQYNNLPMGAERVGNRLFITLPRRRYGIPSTLNYIDLTEDAHNRSPGLRPYPDLRRGRALTSVYRTRADECGRLWMVDTGLLEIPNNRQQVQQPAVVAFDLNTNRQLFRYPLKNTDLVSELTPTGLASITIDIIDGDCSNAYAYIPDLATYGLIVYSLRENDSWRLTHNYFSFDPTAGNLRIAGQSFQWNDGIFSVTLTEAGMDSCRTAYFHPMVGTKEFSVSTCTLRNRTAASSSDFWTRFSVVGDRGANSQSNMHGYHPDSGVVLFADIGRSGVSCWRAGGPLSSAAVQLLAQDTTRLSYPADLHITGDEVWVMANSLPTWAYSRLNTEQYNFYVYKANIYDLISGTVCAGRATVSIGARSSAGDSDDAQPTNTNSSSVA